MGKSSAALGYGKNAGTDDRSGEKGIRISTGHNGAMVTRKEKSGEGTAVPKSMREQMREIAKNAEQGNHIQQGAVQYKGTSANSVLSGTLNYGDAIRQQRLKNADTSRQLKKVKYQLVEKM